MLNSSVQARLDRGEHDRQVLGPAAGHHRVDRDLLDRALDEVGRDDAPRPRRAARVVPSSMRSTRASVGGTTGRPSVQPRSNIASTSSSSVGQLDPPAAQHGSAEAHPQLVDAIGVDRQRAAPGPVVGQAGAEAGLAGERLPLRRVASRPAGRPRRRRRTRSRVGTVSISWCHETASDVSSDDRNRLRERRIVLAEDREHDATLEQLARGPARPSHRWGSRVSRRQPAHRASAGRSVMDLDRTERPIGLPTPLGDRGHTTSQARGSALPWRHVAGGNTLLNVTFYGVRGSTPTPCEANRRYGGNTSCVALEVARHRAHRPRPRHRPEVLGRDPAQRRNLPRSRPW